ncbi:uncharacterized protein SPPG_03194 [Spizellomyces punctatus DAOM BR117]|uniref:C2 domain-containing protein n=1 Tax=Spizellomyces punctatus (strain DAOM BR117) TaxID=645134 RepID=A0A0L0HJT2_SPIPD|nr:uncharacterized protein SPPG_03194 [Spizellomyces punctatus DAOM BR117]KND01382.1 hypothetical protein SPPG_03194 [Spizellomyces punctatus DAOM BR117]|eukprot:XP_016609421.1 hypothetical protein SPPG_03194 [Spizellomyces punctatus DAOM BR117]
MPRGTSTDLRPEIVTDELYNLKSENLNLKRKINDQDDKTKKLITKVQKLTEDLRRAKEPSLGPQTNGSVERVNRREMAEMDDMVDDLRGQLRNMAKENSQLKTKMNFFKALHEAETRKGARYDHIPPRIDSGVRRLHPAIAVKGRGRERYRPTGTSTPAEPDHNSEEVAKLEELVTVLRGKLNDSQRELESAHEENQRLKQQNESQEQQADIERLALQREHADLKKRYQEIKDKHDTLDEKLRGLTETYYEAVGTVEVLTNDLKEERRKRTDLEHLVKENEAQSRREMELNIIIDDLRFEKKLLEEEQARLLQSRFGSHREEEYNNERQILRKRVEELETQLTETLRDKTGLHSALQEARDQCRLLSEAKQKAEGQMYDVQHELDKLQEQMRRLTQNGLIEISQIEEALTFWSLRNQKAQTADFISQADDLAEDKRVLQDLRLQYARCIEDLEKTRRLLQLQEHINKDYKLEVEHLQQKLQATQNEYELRLEEDSRLLDLRSNKIASLEAQLKNIAYGTAKLPTAVEKATDDDDEVELEKGQNLIAVHVDAALISEEGFKLLQQLGHDSRDGESFASFIYFDFYDFETQVTPIGIGLMPHYNLTSRYKVFVDDFFLMYLQSHPMILHLCRSDGLDYVEVATCAVIFKDLTDPHRTDRLQYYGQLVSTHDNKTVIGSINYSLRVRVPMVQAIRSFKERTVALNLLTVGDKDVSGKRFTHRADMNELIVRIANCSGLTAPPGKSPAVYLSFQLHNQDMSLTDTIQDTCNPEFNFYQTFPMPMNLDLDRVLRTSTLEIVALDDNDGLEDYVYGIAKVPLLNLALNENIQGQFDLKDASGKRRGKVSVSLAWEKPYRLEVIPIVSQLDEPSVAAEYSGNAPDRSLVDTVPHEPQNHRQSQQSSVQSPRRQSQEASNTSLVSKPSTFTVSDMPPGSIMSLRDDENVSPSASIDSTGTSERSDHRSQASRRRRKKRNLEASSFDEGPSESATSSRQLGKSRSEEVKYTIPSGEQSGGITSPGQLHGSGSRQQSSISSVWSDANDSASEHALELATSPRKVLEETGQGILGDGLNDERSKPSAESATLERRETVGSTYPTTRSEYGLSLEPHRSVSSLQMQSTEPDREEAITKERGGSEGITIAISELKLNLTTPDVAALLQNTEKVYISFEFLDQRPDDEELETDSVTLADSGVVQFSYSKFFPFSETTNPRGRFRLRRALKSPEETDHLIQFVVVSEPPGDTDDDVSQDLAYASVSLKELMSLEDDGAIFDLTLFERSGSLEMGHLTVTLAGAHTIHTILENG